MMPGDSSMASIVQRIARQALITFRSPPRFGDEPAKSFLENQNKLRSLMTEIRASDLQLVPRRSDDIPSGLPYHDPPCHLHAHLRD
ncbi:hypothetical protein OYC64_012633 [Pagothenia borchgrevinki]|uniref:Uncharacterized protein n=1 Tax=Pagothenia borchgrevinki TaxID=8213 RepID=A0ABD2G940_PAGBO